MQLTDYFKNYRHFIFSGSGGTGKTTLSASWALEAARHGYNVGLITIDPSRRLGSEFGMDTSKESFTKHAVGDHYVDVYLVHSQQIIKDFIHKNFSEDFYDNLSSNRLFNQVSTTLSENQSVSTIYKLSEIINDNKYDLIVVDTPPFTHTVDFFSSPKQVTRIFKDNLVAKAALETKSFKLFSGKKVFYKVLTYLTGEEFVKEMDSFFTALFAFQEHIVEAANHLEGLLKSEDVCYFMVTPSEPFKVKESIKVMDNLREQGIYTKNVIVNRAYPEWLGLENQIEELKNDTSEFALYYQRLWSYYKSRLKIVTEKMNTFDENINTYFLPEAAFFREDFSLKTVQEIIREQIR